MADVGVRLYRRDAQGQLVPASADDLRGATGPAPTLEGGDATLLPPGSDPTVEVRALGAGAYALDIGIPSPPVDAPLIDGGEFDSTPTDIIDGGQFS